MDAYQATAFIVRVFSRKSENIFMTSTNQNIVLGIKAQIAEDIISKYM